MKAINFNQILRIIFFYLLMSLPFWGMVLSAQSGPTAEAYEAILQAEFGEYASGATAIVVKEGKTLYRGAIGMANIELEVKAKPEHVFRIGSITKQFTAVAILQLEEQGKLSITDPITKYIPDYPTQGRTIRIEHLLTHTSGIKSYTNMPEFEQMFRKDLTPMEIVAFFQDQPMEFEPGEKFNYNNSGYILLGVIIEKVSGMPYADYIQKNIFEPVGLKHSYYDSYAQIIPMRAAGYQGDQDNYINAAYLSTTLPYAAGSLLSNVDDLYKWIQAVHAYKLVSEKSLEKAFTPYTLKDGSNTGYAYGWSIDEMYGQKVIEHGGGIPGFLTASMYLPKDNVFVAVFSNCNCKGPETAANKMAALAIGQSLVWEKITLTEAALDQYVGIYEISAEEKQTISREGQQLYATRTGRNRYEIYPNAVDQFIFEDGLTSFQFIRDEKGKVLKLKAFRRGSFQKEAVRTSEVVEIPKAIQLNVAILEEYVGAFDMGPFKVFFTLEDGRLFGQPEGQSKEELFAKAKDQFFLKSVDASLEFIRENGKVIAVKLIQGNNVLEGQLIQEEKRIIKTSFSTNANDLKEYTGVYDAAGRQLTVTLEEGKLYGQPDDDTKEMMNPKSKDHFEVITADGDTVQVEFLRQNEEISGIRVVTPDGNEIVGKKIK